MNKSIKLLSIGAIIVLAFIFAPSFFTHAYTLDVTLENPIANTANDIPEVISLIIDIITIIAIPVLTIIFMYAGFLFVTAMGDKTKLAKAKSMFWGAVIGTALVLGANAMAEALQGTIDALN